MLSELKSLLATLEASTLRMWSHGGDRHAQQAATAGAPAHQAAAPGEGTTAQQEALAHKWAGIAGSLAMCPCQTVRSAGTFVTPTRSWEHALLFFDAHRQCAFTGWSHQHCRSAVQCRAQASGVLF